MDYTPYHFLWYVIGVLNGFSLGGLVALAVIGRVK